MLTKAGEGINVKALYGGSNINEDHEKPQFEKFSMSAGNQPRPILLTGRQRSIKDVSDYCKSYSF